MAGEGSFLENNWASPQKYGDMALVQWASLQVDRLNYQWQRWVVGYQGQSQMDLMSRLPGGFGLRELGYLTAGLIGAALLVAGLLAAWQHRGPVGRDPWMAAVGRWHRLCERAGVPVRQGRRRISWHCGWNGHGRMWRPRHKPLPDWSTIITMVRLQARKPPAT